MNKKRCHIIIVITIIIITILSSTAMVLAANDVDAIEKDLARTAYKMANDVYGEGLEDDIIDLMNVNLSSSTYGEVWSWVRMAYNTIKVIGISIMLVYFLTALLDKVQTENFNLEQFFKLTLKLVVAVILINNGLTLITGSIEFSNKLMNAFKTSGSSADPGTALLNEFYQRCLATNDEGDIKGLLTSIGMFFDIFVPWIACMICRVLVYVLAYGRIFELFGRAVFAPIGMASVMHGGINSSGFKYLKKLVAVAIQSSIIIVIIKIFGFVSASLASEFLGYFQQVILSVTLVTILLKSQSWANDIMGV